MNCEKCGRELMMSHIEKEVVNGETRDKQIFVCLNKACSAYSSDSKIKPRKKEGE